MKIRHYNISPYDAKCIGLPFHGDFYRKSDIDNLVKFNNVPKDFVYMRSVIDTLLPCPFCSSKPEIVKRQISDKTNWYWVQCQNPKCKAETADAYNINDAIEAWNKRVR